jgi:methionyl-tRNA synthetase
MNPAYPEALPEALNNPGFLLIISAWTIVWKGLALWRAAKNNQKYWYVGLLVINLFGIPEAVYLVWFAKKDRWWDKIVRGRLNKR